VRLGISAEVDVDITNQDLPLLASLPPEKPIAKTSIFDIHMQEVNRIMDRIVQDNLQQRQNEKTK
jgi:membrane fusion protein (multidrug efflux system)